MSLTTSPFPPIADYAFLSNCHTGALVAPDGSVDWLCVPAFDSPSAFGNLLDRGAGLVPARPLRHQCAHRADVRARHPCDDHHLAHPRWMDPRPRRLDDGATTGAGHGHPAHQTARRRRRRAPARAHRGVPRRIRRDRTGLRTGVRLRPRTRRVDAGRRRGPLRRRLRRRANPAAEHRPVDRHRRQLRPRPSRAGEGRAGLLRTVVGRRVSPPPPTSPTPPRASRRPSGSGATGSPGRASPTTRCGTRSSDQRSRSRA